MKHCSTCCCGIEKKKCPACGQEHKVVARIGGLPVIGCYTVPEQTVYLLNSKYLRRVNSPELDPGIFFIIPEA